MWGQFVKDFLAHHVVDFGKRSKVEVDAEQLNQAWPLLGVKRLDQRTHIGFMQAADQRAQARRIRGFDPARDAFDESSTDRTVFVARQLRSLGVVSVFLIEHVEPDGETVKARRLYPRLHVRANV